MAESGDRHDAAADRSVAGKQAGKRSSASAQYTVLSADDALSRLSSGKDGLSAAEAKQRLERSGPNKITSAHRTNHVLRFLAQFKDWLIILLLASAVVLGLLAEWPTTFVLLALVLINVTIGFVQELRAEKTMASLAALVHPTAKVVRDGKLQEIDSASVVPGDVAQLDEGEAIPADMRLLAAESLSANEFALTGESEPTHKSTHAMSGPGKVSDRHNIMFAGTMTGAGQGTGVVIATAMDTELGRIASLSDSAPETSSPMQREMATIARIVGSIVVLLTLGLFIYAVLVAMSLRAAVLFAVGLAAALIPQGLPAEVSTSLAQASAVLARHKALVKRLNAVETLGATHVICTDKTGTLTRNEMTVVEAVIGGHRYGVSGRGYAPDGDIEDPESHQKLDVDRWECTFLEVGVLDGSAKLLKPDDKHPDWYIVGDPTEGALLTLAGKAGLDVDGLQNGRELIRELPFDSDRKRMTCVRSGGDQDDPDQVIAYVKGSPESVVGASSQILDGDRVRSITEDDRKNFLGDADNRASRALRNLAFAVRRMDRSAATDEGNGNDDIEQDLVLLGLVSMRDPLRDDVAPAMTATQQASIRVDIVTGDSALTAKAIAKQAGLSGGEDGPRVVTGEQLHDMPDDQVRDAALAGDTVFSRVDPEDKMRIVGLVRDADRVVAVTGDGINDAPALRHASIGVAMGRTGTDVAKDAADVVLLDDSFATLVDAVGQGRTVYTNISRGVLSCLTSNIAEFVVNIVGLVLVAVVDIPLAINVLQILAIDVLGEIIPISALGADTAEHENMRRPPRDAHARILNLRSGADILVSGAVMGVLALVGYLVAFPLQGATVGHGTTAQVAAATTVTYVTILLAQLVNIFDRRSMHGLFARHQFTNRRLWLATLAALLIMGVIVYVPVVAGFFGTAPLTAVLWLPVLASVIVMAGARLAIGRFMGRDFSRS